MSTRGLIGSVRQLDSVVPGGDGGKSLSQKSNGLTIAVSIMVNYTIYICYEANIIYLHRLPTLFVGVRAL